MICFWENLDPSDDVVGVGEGIIAIWVAILELRGWIEDIQLNKDLGFKTFLGGYTYLLNCGGDS